MSTSLRCCVLKVLWCPGLKIQLLQCIHTIGWPLEGFFEFFKYILFAVDDVFQRSPKVFLLFFFFCDRCDEYYCATEKKREERRGRRKWVRDNERVLMSAKLFERTQERESVCVCVCVCVDADFENRRYFFVFFRPIIFSHVVFDLLPDIGTRGSSLRLFIRI